MTSPLDWLADAAAARAAAGLVREVRPVKADDGLDLAGNDYLGLRRHPAVVAGAVAAAETYGGGAGASRLVTGTLDVHVELETALGELVGAPAALVFSTGYAANLAVLTALTDQSTLVISDAHAHASLIDGMRLSRADVAVARHNDVAHVAELLEQGEHSRRIVVVESVYSVLGDLAPLAELLSVTRNAGALLVVDEAHGLGVVGERGEGALRSLGLTDWEHVVVTGTLSKSFASQGGFVLGQQAVVDHLVNTARPFIYDTGLAPAAAGAALAALTLLREDPSIASRVRSAAAQLAVACGVAAPAGAVMSVLMPGPHQALSAVAEASAHGIRIGCFRPPSTPDGSSRLRLTAHAQHSAEELTHACSVLRQVIEHHG